MWNQRTQVRAGAGRINRRLMESYTLFRPTDGRLSKGTEKELKRTGVTMEAVKERYQIDKPEEMSSEIYRKVMSALAKTKPEPAA